MYSSAPLRYEITDIHQLSKCQSNTSNDLKIQVTDFLNDDRISGVRVSLIHPVFGVLFAAVVNSSGNLYLDGSDSTTEMSIGQIIQELTRYGFSIVYSATTAIPSKQLEFLMSLRLLGYHKIRVLPVWHIQNHETITESKVVAFNVDNLKDWLNNAYAESQSNFDKILREGRAVNITPQIDKLKFNMSWLRGFIANIDDVIQEQSYLK